MKIIFLLICVSVTLALVFLIAFLWANKSGQFADDETPSIRMLFDNKKPTKTNHGDREV